MTDIVQRKRHAMHPDFPPASLHHDCLPVAGVPFALTLVALYAYTFKTLLPPQYSLLLPVHSILQFPALLATVAVLGNEDAQ